MQKLKTISLVLVAILSPIYAYSLYDAHTDISAAKSLMVTYSGQTKSFNEGLVNLAGKDGSVKWSRSEVNNSGNQHLTAVDAIVTSRDQKGLPRTAVFQVIVNHSTGNKFLDFCSLDGKGRDIKESSRQIVMGKFD